MRKWMVKAADFSVCTFWVHIFHRTNPIEFWSIVGHARCHHRCDRCRVRNQNALSQEQKSPKWIFTFTLSDCACVNMPKKSGGQTNRKNTMHHRLDTHTQTCHAESLFYFFLFTFLPTFLVLVTCLLLCNSAAAFVYIVYRVHRSNYQPKWINRTGK